MGVDTYSDFRFRYLALVTDSVAQDPQPDETLRLVSKGPLWRWKCACGAPSGRWYGSEEEAVKAGQRHVERHSLGDAANPAE